MFSVTYFPLHITTMEITRLSFELRTSNLLLRQVFKHHGTGKDLNDKRKNQGE
jgi:hypothetical protein